ncbi:MAG TPA: hypothetical protein VFD04_17145 [Actinomycetes bacterium]|jgi:hypothetical protein|nr:hypothetical protein [Actinomycetes bacterium]
MDRLGVELAGLAEEAAAGARAAGAAAARRRGARRRRYQAAATVLLVAGLVAGTAWLHRWAGSPAPPAAPAASTPRRFEAWVPFDPTGDPELRPLGKPVLIAQRAVAGRPYRLWAFQATVARHRGPQVCLALQEPGGAGGSGCEPESWPAGIGGTVVGDQVQLLYGHVSKRAALVRLELARAGVALPPMVVRPLPGGPHLPVNVWLAAAGRTVDVRRVVLLDAAGRRIGSGPGLPASPYLLPPAGPVSVLGHAPSAAGPLRVAAYDAEAAFTCIQVIPDQRPDGGFVKCAPPPPARRPALEADGTCSGPDPIVYGTAPRTARRARVELAGAAPVEGPAFDAGAHFGRAYWAVTVPHHAKVTRVVALDERGAVVAAATPRSSPSC